MDEKLVVAQVRFLERSSSKLNQPTEKSGKAGAMCCNMAWD